MIESHETWTELTVSAPPEHHAALLTGGIGPFLTDEALFPGRRGHFIPDPDNARISVYVRGADDADLRASLSALLRDRGLADKVIDIHATKGARTAIHEVQIMGAGAQALIDDFLVDTTPFVLELLSATADAPSARSGAAFEMMVAQPIALKSRIFPGMRHHRFPAAFVSYRSHVDGFFIMTKDPVATKRAFDVRFERAAAQTQRSLEALVRQLEGGPQVSAVAARWVAIMDRYVGRLLDGLRSGELIVNMGDEKGSIGDNFDLSISPFHAAVHEDAALRERAPLDAEFNTMRIMASLLYLTLHRFGIRLIDRYLLCYTVARSFETVFSVDAASAIKLLSIELLRGERGAPAKGAE